MIDRDTYTAGSAGAAVAVIAAGASGAGAGRHVEVGLLVNERGVC